MEINGLLRLALERGASDLHLVVPNPPILRIDGRLVLLEEWSHVTPEISASVFQAISSAAQRQIFEQEQELDFSFEIPEVSRFRANVSLQRGSISLVFRLVPVDIPTIEELGLPEICKALVQLPRGLVLVTGPTGSGKSSTLAAMLSFLNETAEKKIITIEDPIEFVYPMGNCIISQRQLGSDTKSFANALRHVLRQDPNVIMIGEMRDLETMSIALTAAETGHLVLSTLHTRSAAQSVSRIVDAFPAAQQSLIRTQLADVFEGVVSQVLLRRTGGLGRVAAFEVMIGTTATRNLIRENKLNQIASFIEAGRAEGMRTLSQDLKRLLLTGMITSDEVLAVTEGVKEAEVIGRKTEVPRQPSKGRASKASRGISSQSIKDKEAPESGPGPAEIELTAEELLSAYEVDGEAADAKFMNKVIRMKGIADRIEVNNALGICYILLASGKADLLQRVRCLFDQKYRLELSQLAKGQPITVQGLYDGTMIDIRMRDCVIVHSVEATQNQPSEAN